MDTSGGYNMILAYIFSCMDEIESHLAGTTEILNIDLELVGQTLLDAVLSVFLCDSKIPNKNTRYL